MGYYDDKLPPIWYTKIERAITGNWRFTLVLVLLALWIALAFTSDEGGEPYYGEAYDRTER